MAAPKAPPTSPLEAKFRRSRTLNVILGAACAFLLVVVLAQLGGPSGPTALSAAPPAPSSPATQAPASATPANPQSADTTLVRRDPDDPMAIGSVDAPVVMVMWTDMRCPYCGVFNRDTLPVIAEEYVDTGKVRVEVRDVAFFGEESATAAVAARAAGNQGKFARYLEVVYAAAPEGAKPDLPRDELIAFARESGVPDIDRFTSDLDDPDLRAAVNESTVTAQQVGVSSVPFFVVGNQATAGAQPIEAFRGLLDAALGAP